MGLLHVSLGFNGNCREALEFYTGIFGLAAPDIMTYDSSPADPDWEIPEEAKNLIMYTSIEILGVNVMLSDFPPGMDYNQGKNINLVIVSKDAEEIKKYYNALKEGGNIDMELQKTFWSGLYGMITDKFGIQWQLNLDCGA